MTSFIADGGAGRSTSVIPAVPAASSVATIAFIRNLRVSEFSPSPSLQSSSHAEMTARDERDHPSMQRARYRIDAEGAAPRAERGLSATDEEHQAGGRGIDPPCAGAHEDEPIGRQALKAGAVVERNLVLDKERSERRQLDIVDPDAAEDGMEV